MKILKIGALWCMGCLVMRPRFKEIESEFPWLLTEAFDFDSDKAVVEKYGIVGGKLPTFIFLDKQNQEILRLSGEPTKKELVAEILALKDR